MLRGCSKMELRSLADVFDDLVIYRDLNPMDGRVPGYRDAWHEMGMESANPPRKLDMEYARALAWLLARANETVGARVPAGAGGSSAPVLCEIIYLGDTMLNDGGAFKNLRTLTGWPGWCFIGAEKDEALRMTEQDGLYIANRWTALKDFFHAAIADGATIGPSTVAIVDIDKTAIGGRGRNDKSIDHARTAAMEATLHDAIGPRFRRDEFRQAYASLSIPKYHPFTADNQDNVAYICLMLSAGLMEMGTFFAAVDSGELSDYLQFMKQVDERRRELPPEVRALHDDIYARTLAGDLTPFKTFRRREYQETVNRMGHLPDDAQLAQRLVEEICVTREVLEACEWLKARGCLMVALSDKPDEATSPSPELAARGYVPLHRKATHVVGQGLAL
jgi:hypothetical protein